MKKIVNHKLYWVPDGHEKQYKNWIKKLKQKFQKSLFSNIHVNKITFLRELQQVSFRSNLLKNLVIEEIGYKFGAYSQEKPAIKLL